MLRVSACALAACLTLTACSGIGESLVEAQLTRPGQDEYPLIVSAFVEQCVKAAADEPAEATSNLYIITKSQGSCRLTAKTAYDDDTVIADIMTEDLQRADPRFRRMPNGLLGAAWTIGERTGWSIGDGTPLISLGRSSAKDPLSIRRFGPSLKADGPGLS